eukprot:scaffold3218_cov350-Prasinococcus_capsulatus_cf.AAC.5
MGAERIHLRNATLRGRRTHEARLTPCASSPASTYRLGHVSRARLDLVRFIEHDAMPYVRVHDGLLLQLGAQKIVLHPLGRVHRQVHPALNHFALVCTAATAK